MLKARLSRKKNLILEYHLHRDNQKEDCRSYATSSTTRVPKFGSVRKLRALENSLRGYYLTQMIPTNDKLDVDFRVSPRWMWGGRTRANDAVLLLSLEILCPVDCGIDTVSLPPNRLFGTPFHLPSLQHWVRTYHHTDVVNRTWTVNNHWRKIVQSWAMSFFVPIAKRFLHVLLECRTDGLMQRRRFLHVGWRDTRIFTFSLFSSGCEQYSDKLLLLLSYC